MNSQTFVKIAQFRRLRAHLGAPPMVGRERAPVAELGSSANPQPGKAALRGARFPACGFWRLSSRQTVALSRCVRRLPPLEMRLAYAPKIAEQRTRLMKYAACFGWLLLAFLVIGPCP